MSFEIEVIEKQRKVGKRAQGFKIKVNKTSIGFTNEILDLFRIDRSKKYYALFGRDKNRAEHPYFLHISNTSFVNAWGFEQNACKVTSDQLKGLKINLHKGNRYRVSSNTTEVNGLQWVRILDKLEDNEA